MNTYRKTARIVGVLFIISTVAGVLSVVGSGPIIDAPDYLITASANENRVIIGALLELIMAAAFVSIPVMLFQILKKHNKSIALGYVVARSFEAVPVVVGVISLLSLLTLSQEYVQAGAPDASYFQALGTLLLTVRDWTHVIGPMIFAAIGALSFYYLLYKSRLVPRWLSGWGLIGATLFLAAGLLGMFGLSPFSTTSTILVLPHALQEMVLAVWLIVKGFNPSAIVSGSAKTDINEV